MGGCWRPRSRAIRAASRRKNGCRSHSPGMYVILSAVVYCTGDTDQREPSLAAIYLSAYVVSFIPNNAPLRRPASARATFLHTFTPNKRAHGLFSEMVARLVGDISTEVVKIFQVPGRMSASGHLSGWLRKDIDSKHRDI